MTDMTSLTALLSAIETSEPCSLERVERAERGGADQVCITGLTADSRAVQKGFVFAGLRGAKVDGSKFAAQAVSQGAAALLVDADAALDAEFNVPVIRASRPRRVLALIAAAFHGRQPETAVAVTGTSGKTSVAEFTRQIFKQLGHEAASLGTMGVVKPDGASYGSLTTPDPVSLHKMLSDLAAEGVTHLAFEASSHGLDQYRLDGVKIKAAAFTNLGRDHLDYHPTVEAYLAAKMRLFTEVLPYGGTAVVNIEDGHCLAAMANDPDEDLAPCAKVLQAVEARGLNMLKVGIGRGSGGDLWGEIDYSVDAAKVPRDLTIGYGDVTETIAFPLVGYYQMENALLAVGLAIAAGAEPRDAIAAMANLAGVCGRLEPVGRLRGAQVIVDYAHKPEALETVLTELKPGNGRLICVFGCGGDRDRGKRAIMGEIAVNSADVVIVTDDNPRTEDAAAIRAEILAAAPGACEIGDRAEAIQTAISMAREGDVVVIAGKGHETGQLVGDTVLPFSDQDVARKAIQAMERDDV